MDKNDWNKDAPPGADEGQLTQEKIPARSINSSNIDSLKHIDINSLNVDPTLRPNYDSRFSVLYDKAMKKEIPIYFAPIPLSLCIPYDVDFRPDLHPIGKQVMAEKREQALSGQVALMYVYQRGFWFVVSDDYFTFFAALFGNPEFVPCYILGEPSHPLLDDVQGPFNPENLMPYVPCTPGLKQF
jgi:hypothetical protein